MYYIVFLTPPQKNLPKIPKCFNTRYNAEEFLLTCGFSEEDIDKNKDTICIKFKVKG